MIGSKIGPLVIERLLGEGGMGRVYLARHAVLGTPRVVKVLLPELTRNPTIVQRFINEARAAAAIQHRNIIQVIDVDQLPDGNWYIVLEYLEGGTLRDLIRSTAGPLTPHDALQILAQVANGLGAAHARGIIHRDLKPDNLFLTARDHNDRHVVILDFGIAKLSESGGTGSMTRTGQAIGTPAYMPPEQLRGAKIDQTCDVYALGVIAFQLMTGGHFPFEDAADASSSDASPAELFHRQVTRAPLDPRGFNPRISEAWVKALHGALAPDQALRPVDARTFVIALAEATPSDGYTQDGIEIVRAFAPELLEIGDLMATVRAPMPSRPPKSHSQPPSITVGKYQLSARLGAGGMAEVFRGSVVGAEGFSRPIAIKRVLPGYSEVPAFATMFVSEARLASQLAHPNIVPVIDFDRDPEGRLFLVMEYVEGKDLSALLESGPLPPAVAIFVLTEVLRALGYAHELPNPTSGYRGLIHRDISPHNVLVSWEGAVKVSDFGIAKALEGSGGAQTDQVKGKAAYMSPEQANGEMLDGRSDLFAAGIVLWEALTGRRLFQADSIKAELARVFFAQIEKPSAVRPGISAELDAITMRLLARELPSRYPTAEHVIVDLARCVDNPRDGRGDLIRLLAGRFPLEVRARSKRPARPRAAAQLTALPSTLGQAAGETSSPSRPRRWTWVLAIAGVAVVGALAFAVFRRGAPSSEVVVTDTYASVALDASTPRDQLDPISVDPNLIDATSATPDAGVATTVADAAPPRDAGVTIDAPTTVDAGSTKVDAGVPAITKPAVGVITVRVNPWAEVVIDRKSFGQTPVRATIPAGRHHVEIANEGLGKREAMEVTVLPGKPLTIERNWRP